LSTDLRRQGKHSCCSYPRSLLYNRTL
jgi:hypothetical protein